jgi:hypothetical protein
MELHRDFRELLESFNAHRVSQVLVGAYALAFHGVPRCTGDLVDAGLIDADEGTPPKG